MASDVSTNEEFLMRLKYRKITPEETKEAWKLARGLRGNGTEDDLIWKSTREEGLRMAERIRSLGYSVSEPRTWDQGHENGWGESCYINSQKSESRIGTVGLWTNGGFIMDPVRVHIPFQYSNKKEIPKIKEAIIETYSLVESLKDAGIPFILNPSQKELTEMHSRLEQELNLLNFIKIRDFINP